MDAEYQRINQIKKAKRRTAALSGSVGLFMLVSWFMSYVAAVLSLNITLVLTNLRTEKAAVFISEIFGLSSVDAIIAISDFLSSGIVEEILGLVTIMICLFIPAYVLGKMWGFSVSDVFVTEGKFVKGAIFVFAFCQLATNFLSSISNGVWSFLFPSSGGIVNPSSQVASSDSVFLLVISFLTTCVMTPVVEEYVFRGVVFRVFGKIGTSFAVVASSVCFGLMHNTVIQCTYAIVFGLFSAMLVVVTGNIKTSVLFHALNNTLFFLSALVAEKFGQTAGNAFDDLHSLYILTFSFYGMYLLFSREGILASFREKTKDDPKEDNGAKLSSLFSLPFILFVILFALRAVSGAV